MNEPGNWILIVLFLITGVFGFGMIGVVIYLLKTKNSRQEYLGTYSNRNSDIEDGPVLELPPGVIPPQR